MPQHLGLVSVLVEDYDEAIAFYVGKLGFSKVEDVDQPHLGKRWVVVAPPGATETKVLLARAANGVQTSRVTSAGRLARTLGVMPIPLCAILSVLLAAALLAPTASAQSEKRAMNPSRSSPSKESRAEEGSVPGRTERASNCDLAALSETIELHRRAEPDAARAQLEAIRLAVGKCTSFVLALAYAEEIRKFCAAPDTYSAARTARELRRRIAALDTDEVLKSSKAGQSCQAAYRHELKTTRAVLRPASKQEAQRTDGAAQ